MLRIPRVAAALAVLALFACGGCAKRETTADEGNRTRTLLIGNKAEPATLDPQVLNAFTDMRVAMTLFEGLTVLDDATAKPLPGAAERWDISPDGLVYTFHLRANGKWSNGDPVTAEDFVYSFRRILTPALASVYAYMLWPIKNAEAFNTGKLKDFSAVGITAADARTLRVTLERPTAYLLALAAHSTWFPVPRGTVEKFGKMETRDTLWTRPGNLVGNGAFVLTEWKPNARITVAKNPHYWNAAKNQLERVQFFPIEKSDAEELAYRAGQLHVTFSVPTSKIAVYRQQSPERLRVDPYLESSYLSINVTKPPLNNPKVRRALAMALNRAAICERIYGGTRTPAFTIVPPNCGGYNAPAGQKEDFATARALLAEAGFSGGAGLPALPLQVENDDKTPKAAEIIQAIWLKELGVKTTIEQVEQKTGLQNLQTLAYSLGLSGWIADYPDPYTFLETFRKGNGNNFTGWGSPAYDALLDEAGNTVDPAKRLALLQRAEAVLLEEIPAAPLNFGSRSYLIHPAVKNWQASPLGLNRLQDIELKP